MIDIKPFKALRPGRDKAHLVATRPFYCYTKSVLKAKLASNPYSFLQIVNPNYDLLEENKNKTEQLNRLNLVKAKYAEYIQKGVLIRDQEATFYVYKQSIGNEIYTGIIAASSLKDYDEGKIKKHEATITAREKLFTNYLDVVGYNAEPVLLCHEPNSDLEALFNEIENVRPEYDFTTTDEVKHEMWLMTKEQCERTIIIFKKMNATYIADGHHRSASSALLNSSRKGKKNENEANRYFLSFLMDESKLKIYEYNRLVRNKSGLKREEFLQELGKCFTVLPIEKYTKPKEIHEITMRFEKKWFQLRAKPEIIESNHPVRSLDAEILTNFVLEPILKITDLRSDPNIGFIAGNETEANLKQKMRKSQFDVAFLLYPIGMDQIKKVADNQMIMPPKSTWIEPKIRSGITIYPINE